MDKTSSDMNHLFIRNARLDEVTRVMDIEHAAAQLFVEVNMGEIAAGAGVPQEKLEEAVLESRLLVGKVDQRLVATLLWSVLDEWLFVEEVDVDPAYRGCRYGAAMIAAAKKIAHEKELHGVALTTFIDVPWNAPYYKRLCFDFWDIVECPPALQSRATEEASRFRATRCVMKC